VNAEGKLKLEKLKLENSEEKIPTHAAHEWDTRQRREGGKCNEKGADEKIEEGTRSPRFHKPKAWATRIKTWPTRPPTMAHATH